MSDVPSNRPATGGPRRSGKRNVSVINYVAFRAAVGIMIGSICALAFIPTPRKPTVEILLLLLFGALNLTLSIVGALWVVEEINTEKDLPLVVCWFVFLFLFALFTLCLTALLWSVCSELVVNHLG